MSIYYNSLNEHLLTADLTSMVTQSGAIITTVGYHAVGDGGGDTFRYEPLSTASGDGGFCVVAPVGRYLALDTSVASVKKFGARGDGLTDDTAAIQRAIHSIRVGGSVRAGGAALYFPIGRYVVTDTLDFGNIAGFKCYGDGYTLFHQEPSTSFPQVGSIIVASGTVNPLLKVGMQSFSFADMSFWGVPIGHENQPSGNGLHINTIPGVGTGKGWLDRCQFRHFDSCVVFGSGINDGNSDLTVFNGVNFQEANIAIDLRNNQSVNHQIQYASSVNVKKFMRVIGGGNVSVNHICTVWVEDILDLQGDGNGTGTNNGLFVFNFVGIDPQQNVSPTLVRTISGNYSGSRQVSFHNVRVGTTAYADPNRYLVDVAGSISVYVSDFAFVNTHPVSGRMIRMYNAGFNPSVLFERCIVDFASTADQNARWTYPPSFVTVSGGQWGFKDCRMNANTHIDVPDLGNHPSLSFRNGYYKALTGTDSTPDVTGVGVLRIVDNSGSISGFDGGIDGQKMTVVFSTPNTTIDFTGTNLRGNSGVDWQPKQNDHMDCTRVIGIWYCTPGKNS